VALDGRSIALDPMTHAVRADLADVRLADRVFAPHYAAPVARVVVRGVGLRQARGTDAPVIATMAPGDGFELLDLVGDDAWGIATAETLVGYVDADALREAGVDGPGVER
jgi:hypothetical protein